MKDRSIFSRNLLSWYGDHGRHHLPWQVSDPYKIWVSEVMLQQTQVTTVMSYYAPFIQRFPDVQSLASATLDEILVYWSGLGYYSRARNLHHAAQFIWDHYEGNFPKTRQEWEQCKGVGRSTAAAIVAFAFQERETILDGNVKRVLCRIFAQDGLPGDKNFESYLWNLAESLLPQSKQSMPSYIQGLMDLGAMVCSRTKPKCSLCPMLSFCLANKYHLTDELPKKKKAIDIKEIFLYWLWIEKEGKIYLEKREHSGFWAGLYCFPNLNSKDTLVEYSYEQKLNLNKAQYLSEIQHRFTHRRLKIHTVRLPATDFFIGKGAFYTVEEALALGLPQPIRSLLEGIAN